MTESSLVGKALPIATCRLTL